MRRRTANFFCLAALAFAFSQGFNLDTEFPAIFRGVNNTEFGFAVGLVTNNDGALALVTAPKDDYTNGPKNNSIGILYKCSVSTRVCSQVELDTPYNLNGYSVYGHQYKEVKKNMHLGTSLDILSGSNSGIVTCGHKWKDGINVHSYLLNGACYVIDYNLNLNTVNKLLPLSKRNLQIIGNPTVNNYIHGMAGFSAAYTEDGTHLLLGAPGVYEGIGSLVDYKVESRMKTQVPYVFRPQDVHDEPLTFDSYIGYSVSSGKFFENGITSYVAGAPRAENDHGCVYIFEQFSSDVPIIQEKLIGEMMGEYFGYVVVSANVNDDIYTDLLVGAPFYSNSASSGDEGRVYVYISDGKALVKNQKLHGLMKPGSRFGTAIGIAGDLNLDGYTDIAVGAPYEDGDGAVYLYHGSQEGIKTEFVQRITPKQFKAQLTGFGFSISKGKDIDSNSYPDLLIGAYSSDSAVLLRSHPVITVQADMEFNIKQIAVNSTGCDINGLKQQCFDVTYCFEYFGKFVPDIVDIKVTLETDVQKFIRSRTYFLEEATKEEKPSIETEVTLRANTDNCYDRKVYVKENVEDFITPIPFRMTYNIKESTSPVFCSTCPVLDGTVPNEIARLVTFWTGCGEDNECLSNLKVQTSFLGLSDNAVVIGESKPLILEITTENIGEPAHQSTVYVRTSHNVKIINRGECSVEYSEPKNVSLKCNVGNPLYSGKVQSFQLKLDTSQIAKNLTHLEFEIIVNTTSTEIDPSDNYVIATVPVVSKAKIHIRGSSDIEVYYLKKDEMAKRIPMTHKYTVSKSLPSPVSMVDVTISVPYKLTTNQQEFLEVADIVVENSKMTPASVQCDSRVDMQDKKGPEFTQVHDSSVSRNRYIPSDHPDHSDFTTTVIDCSTAVCHSFHCVVGPFIHQEMVTFQLAAIINLTDLQEVIDKTDIILIMSEGLVTIRDDEQPISDERSDFTMVTTMIEKYDLHKARKIALWIIIVSVIVGIILLVLLILLLVKLGFFRRKEQEEMDKMMEGGHLLKKDEPPPDVREEEMALYDRSADTRNT